jgi:hypothetical protein
MAKHEIFICFSSKDEAIALRVVSFLESRRFKCWISARDVDPGQNYQESIVNALEVAKLVVFLFSENSNQSGEIRKELSLAGSGSVAVIPLRLSEVMPGTALRYELATRQWINAFPDLESAFPRLAAAVKDVLHRSDHAHTASDAYAPVLSKTMEASRCADTPKSLTPIIAPTSDEFEVVRGLLARYIGPMARILVQRASMDARSLNDFCEQLAAHVKVPVDRAAFLQAVRGRLAIKS